MWFAYTNNFANWHVLKIDQVREIIAENKEKRKVASLEDYAIEIVVEVEKNFNNAMGQESLTRFDQPKRKKNNNKKRKPNDENAIVANQNKPIANPNNNSNTNGNNNRNRNKNNSNKNRSAQDEKKPDTPRKPIIITKNENKE
jgi:hypothetical protein